MKILSLGLDNSVLDKNSVLAKRLVKYGELVEKYSVIAPDVKNEKISLSEKANVYGSGGGNKLAQLIKIYYLAKKLLREEKYSLITVQDQYYLALIGWWLANKFKVGLEIQVHGFEKFYGARKLIAQYVLPRAQAVRCVSQRLKKQLIGQLAVEEEKITVVPIFTPVENAKRKTENGKESAGSFVFLTVGRLVPVKNIGLQIEAMREVVKKRPKAELWIVGEGSEKKDYELRITNYGLEKNIKLFGRINNLAEYYGQADVLVLTSNSEGWGLAVIEAAAAGLPIIMTDVGCAGEVIKNGESGLVIPVGDGRKLVGAMLKLIENPEWRGKLASGGQSAVSRLPTEEQTLASYKKSWQKAVKHNMSAQGACLSGRQGSASGRKLLILTQKIDLADGVLGFMHDWVKEFAKHCDKVTVVCLEKGQHDLPENVKILSLGKEEALSKISYIINFYKHIWRERKNYDIVFVHMNPEYAVLAGPLWKAWGKKISLWYTHKNVDAKLRMAEKLSDIIFTASDKSFRLKSKKVNVMGHGIDIDRFIPAPEKAKAKVILSVDRISPTKNQLEIVKLFESIGGIVSDGRLDIVGAPARAADESYLHSLKAYIKDHGLSERVKLLGAVANVDMPAIYRRAKVLVNLSATGSLDKTVLEAMACNLPVVTTNEAFKHVLPPENYSLSFEDARQKIVNFLQNDNRFNYREIVVRGHSLKNLIANIMKKLIL